MHQLFIAFKEVYDSVRKEVLYNIFVEFGITVDRLCGLVVRVSGYRYRGPGFDSRRSLIF